MNGEIERVYYGLPEEIADEVLWVSDEYRVNPLSHIKGGSEIIVEYQNGEVLGYDKIKYPSKFIGTVDPKTLLTNT